MFILIIIKTLSKTRTPDDTLKFQPKMNILYNVTDSVYRNYIVGSKVNAMARADIYQVSKQACSKKHQYLTDYWINNQRDGKL